MNVAKLHELDKWLTPQQAADLSEGVASRPTFQRWAEDGKIEAIRLPNGHYRISKRAIEAMLTPLPTPVEGVTVNHATSGVDADPLLDPGHQSLLADLDRALA